MKKICLVCDLPNWAFDIIAKKLKKTLEKEFSIDIAYFDLRKEGENFFEFLENNQGYDIMHFFWRKTLLLFDDETFQKKVSEKCGDASKYIREKTKKISTGVYDFLFLKEEERNVYKKVFNQYARNYYVISKKLFERYCDIPEYKKPYGVVHDVCDSEKMKPKNISRFDNFNRALVVGWVGNGAINFDGVDLKGLNSIIKPAIKELLEEGYNIVEHYADRNERWRTSDEMPDYYSEIDLCICTSIMEGTPLPIIEAMSCGVPTISTDVGIVSEAFGKLEKNFIIGDREYGKNDEKIKRKLKEKIIELYNNRNLLKQLSTENLKSIDEYDGGKIIDEYRKYFAEFLKE